MIRAATYKKGVLTLTAYGDYGTALLHGETRTINCAVKMPTHCLLKHSH